MAAGGETTTTLSNVLKIRYPQKKLRIMNYKNSQFWGMLKKDEQMGGASWRVTVNYGRSQGSADFTTALANITSDDDAGFTVTRARDYHVCTVSSEAIAATKGDANALMGALEKSQESGMISFNRSVSQALYRNGGGARGRLTAASNPGTASVTLRNPEDSVPFEINMYIASSAADGTSGAVRVGSEKLAGVNRRTGVLTSTSANWNVVTTAMAASDFLFRAGDFSALLKGLQAWLPASDPTSGDSFFGIDRSVDPMRLAGVRFIASSGAAKEDTIIDCASLLGREGGMPDHVLVNPADRADMIKNLGSKAQYVKVNSQEATIGYKALQLDGDKGPIAILSDANCPKGTFFMQQLDTWTLGSLGAVPHFAEDDGTVVRRQASADGVEWRLRMYGQLFTDAPGWNATGTF